MRGRKRVTIHTRFTLSRTMEKPGHIVQEYVPSEIHGRRSHPFCEAQNDQQREVEASLYAVLTRSNFQDPSTPVVTSSDSRDSSTSSTSMCFVLAWFMSRCHPPVLFFCDITATGNLSLRTRGFCVLAHNAGGSGWGESPRNFFCGGRAGFA